MKCFVCCILGEMERINFLTWLPVDCCSCLFQENPLVEDILEAHNRKTNMEYK